MGYEELYKNAIANIKEIYNQVDEWTKAILDARFPELKESEDERIREFIAETVFRYYGDSQEYLDVLAYLEKQKEPHFTKRNALFDKCVANCDPVVMKKVSDEVDEMLQKEQKPVKLNDDTEVGLDYALQIVKEAKGNLRGYQSDDGIYECDHAIQTLECILKNGIEQKPNVIIPKFRIGDTICLKGSMAEYTIESIDAECYHGKGWGLPISAQNNYELVEQKPAEWSEEDERCLQKAIECAFGNGYLSVSDWLKDLPNRFAIQQKQEWSEEDEDKLKKILATIQLMGGRVNNNATNRTLIYWLKALSKRFSPQPKQEWSEEDERLLNIIIDILDKEEHNGHLSHNDLISSVKLIKSLCPYWKPGADESSF